MKIKKKHVGQEFLYIGENTDHPLGKLTFYNKVKLVKVFGKELTDSDLCVVENEKGIWIFCNKQDLARPIEWPPLFTGVMIKGVDYARDMVEVSETQRAFKSEYPFVYYIGDNEAELKHVSFGEKVEIIKTPEKYGEPPSHLVVKTSSGVIVVVHRENVSDEPPSKEKPFLSKAFAKCAESIQKVIDDRIKNASINKANPEFENLKAASELIERQLYDVKYPDIYMEDDDDEDPSTSIPLDQETADAIKAMVDKMVGKQLVDFGVGYASPDSTDDKSITNKRRINSISIKVD